VLPIVVIIAIFWFLIVRPQMRRSRETRDLQSQLSVGDHVMLTSGIYAEIAEISSDHVQAKLTEDVVIRMARGAVMRVLTQEELVAAGIVEAPEDDETVVPGEVDEAGADTDQADQAEETN